MKAENMIDAIGHLDEQLLSESLPAKRRNFRPLVAVAAVAAALAVTAGAVNLFGDDHWRLFYSTQAWGDQFTVQATYGGTVFPLEQLKKWKADIEQGVETVVHRNDGSVMDAVVHVAKYQVSSLEQAERFLGVDLLAASFAAVGDCRIEVSEDESETVYVDVTCTMEPAGEIRQLWVYLSEREDVQLCMHHEPDTVEHIAQYDIPLLGITAYVVENLYRKGETTCYFAKDGVAYEVSIAGDVKTAELVLDSFHY